MRTPCHSQRPLSTLSDYGRNIGSRINTGRLSGDDPPEIDLRPAPGNPWLQFEGCDMGWKRKAGIGCGGVLLLLIAAFGAANYFRVFVPAVEVAEPGPTGRRVSEGGLLGNFYPGRGAGRRPGLLALGGSEGGIGKGAARNALALQAEGFSVLSLSYHRAPGQPQNLELIPLETFSAAISWLQRQPEVDPGRIGIVGVSKGAEAALLAATRDPRIKAVVAGAPSSVAWQGSSFDRDGDFASSWTERGRPLDHLAYGRWKWWTDMAPILAESLKTLPSHPGAAIPIERTAAPVLLVCGEADTLWPSCPMARQLEQRARRHGRPAVTLLAYPSAGHGVFGPPGRAAAKAGSGAEATNRARRDAWPRAIALLKSALEGPPPATAP
jgi:dienelactone hydrolase